IFTLDLSTWKQCKVLTVESCGNKYTKITLEDKRCKEKAICHLLPPWNTNEYIMPGLTVSVLATKVDVNSDHFVVNAEADNSCKSLEDVETIASNVMKTRKMVTLLYATRMTISEALGLVDPYLKEIEMFLNKYLATRVKQTANSRENRGDSNNIMICAIEDIEENIWCHQLGVKGKIDATVSVRGDEGSRKIEKLPLELKTGRASYSFEHLGQLALYEMMMNLVGHHVNGGLLLYLRDGKFSRMAANRNMKRDLIMLRNEVARYFNTWMTRDEKSCHCIEELVPMKFTLPDPINNERACAKCAYNTVCIALSKREMDSGFHATNHGLFSIAEESCGHLKNVEIDYFIQWAGLIYLEQHESPMTHTIRNIWNMTPQERCEKGSCIAGLALITPIRAVDDLYFHTFALDKKLQKNDPNFDQIGASNTVSSSAMDTFQIGEYVICSTPNRIAVASGHIISRAGHELVVSFERDLSANYSGEKFMLDQSASYQSTGFNLCNLAMLLRKDDTSTRLRRIIVDRVTPSFTDGILSKSIIPAAKEILKHLNRFQKQAALKAAASTSYCLLKGLPGTGKTQTIVGLIRLLLALGESILLTSNTHSAVDNVLKRLLPFEDIKFLRLGSIDRIDPDLKPHAESVLTENCETPTQLMEVYNQFSLAKGRDIQ
uniref:DNA helicase n=1 Tax=Anopheles dirus TaxID=7168 RepID=A0A182N8E0_9DIPT